MARTSLCKWQSPADFIAMVDELMSRMGGYQFFAHTKAASERDAWVAAKLASSLSGEAVRLGPDEWPDFEIRGEGRVRQYEITEADIPGRRRGDEYKAAGRAGSSQWEMDLVENWVARAMQAPGAIRQDAIGKANKGYPPSARLVIYLNIGEYGVRQKEIEAAMAESTSPAKDAFHEVWVLWKTQLYLLWNEGVQRTLIVRLQLTRSKAYSFSLSKEDFDEMPPLNTEAGQAWMDAKIDETKPDLAIFDNIQSLVAGDHGKGGELGPSTGLGAVADAAAHRPDMASSYRPQ